MSRTKNTLRNVITSLTLVSALGLAGSAAAADSGPGVQVKAKGDVDSALSKLKKLVAGNGMMVMGELHQGKVLAMTGITVKSESVFIGNPTVGKKLFSAEPGAGLAVPIRVNLYEDSAGNTWVSYVPPSKQLGGFNNAKVNKIAGMLDQKLHKMTQMLAK